MSSMQAPYNPPMEELTPEQQEQAKRFATVRNQNQRLIHQLSQLGAGVDTITSQLEFYFRSLVALEVITADQFWDTQVNWQEELRSQLIKVKTDVEARAVQVATKNRLWTPEKGGPKGDGRRV